MDFCRKWEIFDARIENKHISEQHPNSCFGHSRLMAAWGDRLSVYLD